MKSNTASKSLVLVVGAGASKEANLPLGSELKGAIAKALDIRYEDGSNRISGDRLIDEALRTLSRSDSESPKVEMNEYLNASRQIALAMPQASSIDNFIDSHRGDKKIALCGKLAIVRAIIDAEKRSKLYIDLRNSNNRLHFDEVEDTWFNSFFQLIVENCHRNELADRLLKVAIITFNYDRCIEHYLHEGLQNYYGISSAESAEALKSHEIYHPYGTVGQLKWQSPRDGIEFGGDLVAQKLIQLTNGIRTFTEGIDPKNCGYSRMKRMMTDAERIVFLGFAFHKINIKLLFDNIPHQEQARNCAVYGTSLGLSNSDVQAVSVQISTLANFRTENVFLSNPFSCFQLIREYSRSLSLS